MFYSLDRGDHAGSSDTGLALAICHGSIAARDGAIEALAGPDGQGTTIRIMLPVSDPPFDAAQDV